ncbi:fungal hydrophobin [Mycena rebaudengoi]|nr:fungal hydrophobin [Mycena rebaudengoi]
MFSKLSVIVASVLVTLAAATPMARNTTPPHHSSGLPPVLQQRILGATVVVSSSSTAASAVAGLLGLDLTGLDVPIGLSCSPITVGNNCGSTTVNCAAPEKEWGGLIAINCIPITL